MRLSPPFTGSGDELRSIVKILRRGRPASDVIKVSSVNSKEGYLELGVAYNGADENTCPTEQNRYSFMF